MIIFHILYMLQASTLNLEFYFRNDTNKCFINWNQPLHFWENNSIFNATAIRIYIIYVRLSVCPSVCHWKISVNENLMLFEIRNTLFYSSACLYLTMFWLYYLAKYHFILSDLFSTEFSSKYNICLSLNFNVTRWVEYF